MVDHQIAAAGQPHLPPQRPGDLFFQRVRIEDGFLPRVQMHPVAHWLGKHLHKIIDLLQIVGVIDDKPLDVLCELVADQPEYEIVILMQQRGRLGPSAPGLNSAPQFHQELNVARDLFLAEPFGDCAHDNPHPLGLGRLRDFLQSVALDIVVYPTRNPHVINGRHQHHIPAGEGDVSDYPSALGADRFLAHLDNDLLSGLENILDRTRFSVWNRYFLSVGLAHNPPLAAVTPRKGIVYIQKHVPF